MVFSSIVFLIYFLPVFLFSYYMTKKSLQNYLLLGLSIFFYSWGAPRFIFVLLAVTAIDFYLVKLMFATEEKQRRKVLLAISICLNMGLLAYFKYSNFFIENFNAALSSLGIKEVSWTKVVLPIGISFFTFETLTYSIDAYRKVIKPLDKLRDYFLYILLFPKLIAGPIVRFNLIEKQIHERNETDDDRLSGFYRFCLGLGKKVLIANVLAAYADSVMSNEAIPTINSTQAWLGIICYTMQIYFDFSGYSDMAIGLAKMIGFRFPENFDNPYTSRSITEFWRRWHMTLGMWMREYLYIPLGGNRVSSKTRLYFNLWIVFLLSGLWHGASWNFVLWGAFHGMFLVLDKMFLLKFLSKIGSIPAMIITFIVVMMGWVLFRLENIDLIAEYYKKLWMFNFREFDFRADTQFTMALILSFVFSWFTLFKTGAYIQDKVFFKGGFRTICVMVPVGLFLFFLCVASLTSNTFNPFIYFRF